MLTREQVLARRNSVYRSFSSQHAAEFPFVGAHHFTIPDHVLKNRSDEALVKLAHTFFSLTRNAKLPMHLRSVENKMVNHPDKFETHVRARVKLFNAAAKVAPKLAEKIRAAPSLYSARQGLFELSQAISNRLSSPRKGRRMNSSTEDELRSAHRTLKHEVAVLDRVALDELAGLIGDEHPLLKNSAVIDELSPARVLHLMDRYCETEGGMLWKDELGADWSAQRVGALYPVFRKLFPFEDYTHPGSGVLSVRIGQLKSSLNGIRRKIEVYAGDRRSDYYVKLCENELALENKLAGSRAWAHWTDSPAARGEPLHPAFDGLFRLFSRARVNLRDKPKITGKIRFDASGLHSNLVHELKQNGFETWRDFVDGKKSIEYTLAYAVAKGRVVVSHIEQLHREIEKTFQKHAPS